MDIFDAAGMREADRRTIEDAGLPGLALMETAGRMAGEHLLRAVPEAKGGVLIVCGKGNNGGDGFVLARYLLGKNIPCQVIRLFPIEAAQGDCAQHLAIALKAGIHCQEALSEEALRGVFTGPKGRWVRVDAILGTGLNSPVRGLYKAAIDRLYDGDAPVLALDLPSGLHPDTGQLLGVKPNARATSTFGGLKLGLTVEPGASASGAIEVMDIGLVPRLTKGLALGTLLSHGHIRASLPVRRIEGHKGTFGHVLIVAGSAGKVGAAALCAGAALRSGVGLVTLALPKGAIRGGIPMPPEAMIEALPDTPEGALSQEALAPLKMLSKGKSAIAVGPGIGTGEGAWACLQLLLGQDLPTVVDADALNLLALHGHTQALGDKLILTPHPGELARLRGVTSRDIQGDRVFHAKKMASASGSLTLLKGARTVIAQPSGFVAINPTGNPGMGTGGSGDVLTGLLGGLLAQGLTPWDAACAGAYIHGLAGDLARDQLGARALIAGDLISGLSAAFLDILGEGA